MKYLTLDEIHAALLEILVEFDRVCREHNLCYSLMGGTLLGAVRHKGFIPWDDDVDVMMPRPDYERLYQLIHDGTITFNKHFLMSEDRGKKAPYPFMKLMDDRYVIKSTTHIEVPYLFVDVFPMDGIPDLPQKKLDKLFHKERFYNFVVIMTKWYVFSPKWWGYFLRVLCFWFYPIWICYGRARAIRKLNKLLAKHSYENYMRCDQRAWRMRQHCMNKSVFDSLCEIDFEERKLMAISDWHNWLSQRYGANYMQPPPKNKRLTHGLKVVKNTN